MYKESFSLVLLIELSDCMKTNFYDKYMDKTCTPVNQVGIDILSIPK